MRLLKLDASEKEKYQAFVKSKGSFLQDWEWGRFQESQGKKVFRIAVEENGEWVLTAQLLQNTFRGKKYFYLPYGPVASSSEAAEFFLKEISSLFPEAVFVRIEPQNAIELKEIKLRKSADLNPHKTLVLDLKKSEEELLKEMHPKTRYNIKVAAKHEVAVKVGSEFGEEVAEIFENTAKRAGVRFQHREYFKQMLQAFSEENGSIKARIYSAKVEGKINAANIMIFWNKTAIYLFGGSSEFKRNSMSPYALHWQAIQDSKQRGLEFYDFWGVEEDPNHPWHGFSRFKLGFGGTVVKYAGTFDYLIQPAWYNVYNVLRKLNRIVRR